MSAASYFITTPYIDAYRRDWDLTHPPIPFETFEYYMKQQAREWGEQGLGRALLNREALPTYDDPEASHERYVLAFGEWDEEWYVAVEEKDELGNHNVKVIKQADDWSIPEGWDVT